MTAQNGAGSDEDRARQNGWVPENEWRGDPTQWRDAKTFNERADTYPPALRRQLQKEKEAREFERLQSEERIRQLEQTFDKKFKATQRMTQEALRLQRSQMLEEFENQKRAAVAAGDTQAYDAIRKKEDKVYQQIAEQDRPEPEPAPQAAQASQEAILQKWLQQNRWMNNHFLAGKAQAIAQRYADKGVTGVEQLQNVRDDIFKAHPDMVAEYGYDVSEYVEKPKPAAKKPDPVESDPENTDPEGGEHEEDEHDAAPPTPKPQAKKRSFAPVEGGTPSRGTSARVSNKRDWKSIPEGERKELFNNFVKPGYFKDTPESLARLAKSWWDSNSPEE
jgi:hypothetical protein